MSMKRVPKRTAHEVTNSTLCARRAPVFSGVFLMRYTYKHMRVRYIIVAISLIGCLVICPVAARAQSSQSPNFRIDESFIGPGGTLESGSDNYKTAPGGQSIGNQGGAGDSRSANFRAQSGATTTSDPSLACVTNTSSVSFGSLSSSVAATATATFSVLNYTSFGYIVQTIGTAPSSGGHTLSNLSSNAASTPGTEQFGINLVDNSSPNIGADPQQVPSSSFSFGEAATNYGTANSFRYVNGETIALAPETSGQTDYTISYIINIATTTPGGSYSGSQVLVCTGTY